MDTGPHNGSQHRDEGETYSPVEAGRVLGVSDERIRQLIEAGEIEGEKRAGRWHVFRWSVHDALKEPLPPPSSRWEAKELVHQSPRHRDERACDSLNHLGATAIFFRRRHLGGLLWST